MWSNLLEGASNALKDAIDREEEEESSSWNQQDDGEEPSPQQNNTSLFGVGRLKRFMEQVTQPEDETDSQNAWDEEEDTSWGLDNESMVQNASAPLDRVLEQIHQQEDRMHVLNSNLEIDEDHEDEQHAQQAIHNIQQDHSQLSLDHVQVVDHVPPSNYQDESAPGESSLLVGYTANEPTVDLTVDTVTLPEEEQNFLPVVDQLPVSSTKNTLTSNMTAPTNRSILPSELEADYRADSVMSFENSDDGWSQPNHINDEESTSLPPPLVDHTPSEMIKEASQTKSVHDPSISVLKENDTDTSDDDNDDDNHILHHFGPVVDHTPQDDAQPLRRHRHDSLPTNASPTPGTSPKSHTPTALLRSDSVAATVEAQELATVEDLEEEGEEESFADDSTVNLGSTTTAVRTTNPLVDHVPQGPFLHKEDDSVGVAADPSEVFSTTDDNITQEEGNFGPVVDHTPEVPSNDPDSLLTSPTGGAASTAAFAPLSVGTATDFEDDDDDGREGWGDDDELLVGNSLNDDHRLHEDLNPQSDSDVPAGVPQVGEQVVDFLPPPPEEEPQNESLFPGGHLEDSSSVAAGGGLSLLPQDEPNADDFGPVVDHLPQSERTSAHSGTSVATQFTASECQALEKEDRSNAGSTANGDSSVVQDNVVVENLSQMRNNANSDSVATVAQSQLSDDEGEDLSQFGPVVDQLPTSRASLAPSRGGSTVDALATVSEVDSDEEGGDTWDEDDADLDISETGTWNKEKATQRTSLRSSLNSELDKNVSVRFESSVSSPTFPEVASNDASQYYDAELASTTIRDQSEYYDPDEAEMSGWDTDINLDDLVEDVRNPPRTTDSFNRAFAEADTPPSTPHQKPLDLAGDILGALSMSKDYQSSTEREFSRKLFEERSRREELERELEQLRHASLVERERGPSYPQDHLEAEELARVNEDLLQRLEQLNDELSLAKEKMLSHCAESQSGSQVRSVDDDAKDEVSQLRTELAERNRILQNLETDLTAAKRNEDSIVRDNALRLQSDIRLERDFLDDTKNRILQSNLQETGNANLPADIEALIDGLERLRVETSTVGNILIDPKECWAKLSEIREAFDLARRDCKAIFARFVEAESCALGLKGGREDACAGEDLSNDKIDVNETIIALEDRCKNAEKNVRELEIHSQGLERLCHSLRCEKEEALTKLETYVEQHEKELAKQYALLDRKSEEMKILNQSIASSEQELVRVRLALRDSESMASELISVSKERDLLQDALLDSKEAVKALQKHIDEHGMEQQELNSKRELENASLHEELKHLTKAKQDATRRAEEADKVALSLRTENGDLRSGLKSREVEYSALEASRIVEQEKLSQLDEKNTKLEAELQNTRNSLRSVQQVKDGIEKQLSFLSSDLGAAHQELSSLREQNAEIASSKASLELQLEKLVAAKSSSDRELSRLCEEVSKLQKLNTELENSWERKFSESNNQSQEKLNALEAELESTRSILNSSSTHPEEIEIIKADYQALAQEKEALLQENEEMLIQFGLLKENMDSYDEALNKLVIENEELKQELSTIRSKDYAANPKDDDANSILEEMKLQIRRVREEKSILESELEAGRLQSANTNELQLILDEQIRNQEHLKKESETLSASLQSTRERLASKEHEVDQLNARIRALESQVDSAETKAVAHPPGDNVDNLRSHVISLAVALERSENRRAEAIEALLNERQTNSESLRKLSESVKRFYSTVSFGDQ